jgi:hypothetical protein
VGATNRGEQDTPVGIARTRIEQNAAKALARAAGRTAEQAIWNSPECRHTDFLAEAPRSRLMSNVRDQRRRAVGAPLAGRNPSAPVPVRASGVTTRDDRCIA